MMRKPPSGTGRFFLMLKVVHAKSGFNVILILGTQILSKTNEKKVSQFWIQFALSRVYNTRSFKALFFPKKRVVKFVTPHSSEDP